MLIYAIAFINIAFAFYTAGVWGEKIQGKLKVWHVVTFWIGLICDTTGTTLMGKIAGSLFQVNFHGVTGLAAVLLMVFHAIWATWVIVRKNEILKAKFHKFSIVVWIIWLIPMVSGAIFGLTR